MPGWPLADCLLNDHRLNYVGLGTTSRDGGAEIVYSRGNQIQGDRSDPSGLHACTEYSGTRDDHSAGTVARNADAIYDQISHLI